MLCPAFHVNIQARSPRAVAAGPIDLKGRRFIALTTPGANEAPPMFTRSFEEVVEALSNLPRMFVEPDGAFVWVASSGPAWQLDGMLHDGRGRLWCIEAKGRCPPAALDQLLSAAGWPQTPVAFQLVREAALLDEATFRDYIGGWPSQAAE